jgi:TRAP-type C4-dicarboxylate transport system substrate-binding protein
MKMVRYAIALGAVALGANGASFAAEPVTLKLAFPPPPVSFFNGGVLAPWAKEIEEETKGELKVQIYVGGSVANFNNVFDRIVNGVVDLGWGLHGPMGTKFAKSTVTNLPGLVSTGPQCTTALWNLIAGGVAADEYNEVKPLAVGCFPGSSFIANRPLRSVEDFKGMKVSVGSKILGSEMELLGAAPISLTTAEVYQSLQRGTVEISAIGWAAVAAFKLHEVAKWGFEAPMGHATNFLLMNKESFAKLPEGSRRALEANSGAKLAARMGKAGDEETQHGRKMVQQMPGWTITTMPEADLARLQQAMQPLVDQWLKDTPDGARVLAAYKTELEKARKGM